MEIERRYFVDLVTGHVAKTMVEAFFFDLQQVNGDRRPAEGERYAGRRRSWWARA